jgi:hypothetical protein
VDFSAGAIDSARKRASRTGAPVQVYAADALRAPLPDGCADTVVCVYGVKTLAPADLERLVREVRRLLRPGGSFSLAEIQRPSAALMRLPFMLYLRLVVPVAGKLLLGNPATYRMLSRYVDMFEGGAALAARFAAAGFTVRHHALLGGCGTVVVGSRPASAPQLPPTAQPVPGALSPGDTLDGGRYQVRGLLARGGMGALYTATDTQGFGRSVAIKLLADGIGAEALAREARRLAALSHPAVPRLLGYLWESGRGCLVMEQIDGANLHAGLSGEGGDAPGKAYALDEVVRWGLALSDLLIYLVARQPEPVIHGDIKPENLVLDSASGALYLVDFGAGSVGAADGAAGGYGTPGYAAPEQYRGRPEPRSDVYGLAATLYHLATDDDPTAHPFAFPRLAALGDLGAALRPALLRDPARRPDAAGLRAALIATQLGLPGPALPAILPRHAR